MRICDSNVAADVLLSAFCFSVGALIVWLDVLDAKKVKSINVLKYLLISGVVFLAVDLSFKARTIAESISGYQNMLTGLRGLISS